MQRNGFNYAVEMHHGNHPKQCISEMEREVGFYRHDQWGFACLADVVHTRCLQRRGWPPTPVLLLFDKQSIQGININTMHNHMNNVAMCCSWLQYVGHYI